MQHFARNIVEAIRHPFVILDASLLVRGANPAFYRTFGLESAQVEGFTFFEVAGGLWDTLPLRTLLQSVLPSNGSFEDFALDLDSPTLGRRSLLLDGRKVADDETGEFMILLAIEDVTQKRLVDAELRRLNAELESRVSERTAQLESAVRELEAFSYSVSHDLRTPLRAIEGFSAELVASYADKKLDEKGLHYLRRVQAGSVRMSALIDDLLQLSRLTRCPMICERFDLAPLAESVISELREKEPDRCVDSTVAPELMVRGDPRLVRIAVENLVRNAWKFTSKKAESSIHVGRVRSRGMDAVCIRDDGAGFDQAHAANLFGAFQRFHTEREFPGTGIGLATVQRVVNRHGGQVWAESQPGLGASIYFTLPDEELS